MVSGLPNSDQMSQGSTARAVHPTHVSAAAPAAAATRTVFSALTASSVGLEFGVSVVIGALFGRWLDGQLGTTPWLMIVLLGFGFAAGVRSMMRAMRKLDREHAVHAAPEARRE